MYEKYHSHLDYVPIRQGERKYIPPRPSPQRPPPVLPAPGRMPPPPHAVPTANLGAGLDRLFSFFPMDSELFLCGLLFCLYLESRDSEFLILLGAYFYYSRGRSLF